MINSPNEKILDDVKSRALTISKHRRRNDSGIGHTCRRECPYMEKTVIALCSVKRVEDNVLIIQANHIVERVAAVAQFAVNSVTGKSNNPGGCEKFKLEIL